MHFFLLPHKEYIPDRNKVIIDLTLYGTLINILLSVLASISINLYLCDIYLMKNLFTFLIISAPLPPPPTPSKKSLDIWYLMAYTAYQNGEISSIEFTAMEDYH